VPESPLTAEELKSLVALDTPTVCNALEVVAPQRRGFGYTVKPFVAARPQLPPIVGYARTATIRAMHPSDRGADEMRRQRLDYYRYVAEGPNPSIMVIEDLDASPGYGAFWGEVQSNLHKGLGCLGVITNGCVRDIPQCAEGFQMLAGSVAPSHAYVHLEQFDVAVTVHGMTVRPGDLIHADPHGAVVVPLEVARKVPEAAAAIARREAHLIGASRRPDFSYEMLTRAIREADEIH
jgi:regulator of RNase E activity RraA